MMVKLKNAQLGSKEFERKLAERLLKVKSSDGKVVWELDDKKFYLKDGSLHRRASERDSKSSKEQA